ncbi:MAG: VOC family protein [Candidatus Thiodiazotropha sp. (ex Codakia rugifera)]|nr:VOC family protein [Candidatus Thiodiazotropha sp. (ex Codakia rugifera)]
MNISNIDHIVLTVKDIDVTLEFYESVLGMAVETFGEDRVALKFGNKKINLHKHGHEFEPKAKTPTPGSGDLCFITETELKVAMAHVKSKGIVILEGPVSRTGATGPIVSFYFRDPDGNLVEVANHEKST